MAEGLFFPQQTTQGVTLTVKDTQFILVDDGDQTKKAQFQCSSITTATTRTFTFPDTDTTFVGTGATQTITNKTLMTPVITYAATATKSSNYTVATGDRIIPVTSGSAWTLTLPAASVMSGQIFEVINIDTSYTGNAITISGSIIGYNGSEGDWKIYTPGEKYRIFSDGTSYYLMEHQTDTTATTGVALTITGTTSNPTKGTMTTDTISWYRKGRFARVQIQYIATTAGAGAGSGLYLITLPNSLTIDTAYSGTNTSTNGAIFGQAALLGSIQGNVNTGTSVAATASPYNTTAVTIRGVMGGTNGSWSSSTAALNNTNVQMGGWFEVPISGWKA